MPERLRRTLVGAVAAVIRMAQSSPDGMALANGDDGWRASLVHVCATGVLEPH
ncbi:hypothetical protein SSCG_02540 [Streptomyces clavuligerus]|nr:hypothetical protein SSCG_02540 [Streptomyces clavuligerus]